MKWIIIYMSVAVLFEVISGLLAWRKWKRENKNEQIKEIFKVIMEQPSFKDLKKKVFNWYTIPIIIIPFCVVFTSLMFPLTLFRKLRRLIFGKTKLEKQVDEMTKAMEESRKASEEFMKTEGVYINDDNMELIGDSPIIHTIDEEE